MKVGKEYKVEITQLKISKPFLKVVARNVSQNSTEFLDNLKLQYEKKRGLNYDVELGALYIACVSPTRFERCRVIQANEVEKTALVVFIDCGYQCVVWYNQLKIVDSPSTQTLKPLCREFTIAGTQLKQSSNYSESILQLHDMIVGKEVIMVVKGVCATGELIDLKMDNESLANEIIPNHQFLSLVLTEVPLDVQIALIAEKKKERDRQIEEQGFTPATLVESPENQRKEFCFVPEAGVNHEVRISAYEDGPYKFFVQFISQDSEYQKFQCNLQSCRRILEKARVKSINSKYIALIDGHLHRVILLPSDSDVPDSHFKAQHLETGTKSLVASGNLYAIPNKVAGIPPFAIQYKLADLQKVDLNVISKKELNFYFQHITNQKQLVLRVEQRESGSSYCQLFRDQSSIIDDCVNWRPQNLRYAPQKSLRGNDFRVQVCYAESPNLFFVHVMDNNDKSPYRKLRKSLEMFASPVLRNPHAGCACVVKHMDKNVRGKIIEWLSTDLFKVEFVDFGFVETFAEREIKITDKEFLKLPPLAVECCLKEYDGAKTVEESVTKQFEKLCREIPECDMRIVKRDGNRYIVEVKDWKIGAKNSNQQENLNQTDWSEANTTFGTHFENHRRAKRKLADGSDDEEIPLDEMVANTSDCTIVEVQELPWQEHVVVHKPTDWSGDWESQAEPPIIPTNKEPESDENSSWSEKPSQPSESTEKEDLPCLSPSSSSGIYSIPYDAKLARIPVRITALTSPTEFTIQKISFEDDFKLFQEELQAKAVAQSPMTAFEVDKYCLAYSTLEEKWVRAIILDVNLEDFMVSVKCLDTGSTFSILQKKYLKNIPVDLIIFTPRFAYRCSLPIRHDLNKEDKISSYLLSRKDQDLTCHFLTVFGTGLHFIELFQGDLNVTDFLVKNNYAKRQVIAPTGFAFVSHATSHRQFAVQMEETLDLLDTIRRYADDYKLIEVEKPEVDMLVMVPVSRKNKFNRGSVVSVRGEKIRVYLVDTGEYLVVDKVGQIDAKAIAEIPPIAIKCSLLLPSSAIKDKEVSRKFKQLADKGRKRFFVRMVQPGDESALVNISFDSNAGLVNIAGWLLKE